MGGTSRACRRTLHEERPVRGSGASRGPGGPLKRCAPLGVEHRIQSQKWIPLFASDDLSHAYNSASTRFGAWHRHWQEQLSPDRAGCPGAIVLRQKLSRGQVEALLANMPCRLISMEACVGAHHLRRQLLALGHDVKRKRQWVIARSRGACSSAATATYDPSHPGGPRAAALASQVASTQVWNPAHRRFDMAAPRRSRRGSGQQDGAHCLECSEPESGV